MRVFSFYTIHAHNLIKLFSGDISDTTIHHLYGRKGGRQLGILGFIYVHEKRKKLSDRCVRYW